jgi:hypothetical protein
MSKMDELPEVFEPAGIVIRDGAAALLPPRIVAFIWGGRVAPIPTLPFGRWKSTTA